MNNKILIKLIVPDLDDSFDIFIPVNELVWKIKKLIVKTISDITNIESNENNYYILINKSNTRIYQNNEIIINTDIRNGSEIILICQN
ncbi:MAG: hypothetical protein IJ509_01085 [Bacilli bacterium]|nr:hypothetical protein [Bacilli bacterium]